MLEMGTSGLMSGVGKRDGASRQHPRPTSTLPFLKPVRPTGSAGGLAAGVGQALSPANPPAFSRRQAILIFTA